MPKIKEPKYPHKPYPPAKPTKTLKDYKYFNFKDKTLKNLLDFLPKEVKPEDVMFDIETSIEYGYYNEPSAVLDSADAYFYVDIENVNYEKQMEDYKANLQKHKEKMKIYKQELKLYEEWQTKKQIEHAENILKKFKKV
jgi:hypothetical protein